MRIISLWHTYMSLEPWTRQYSSHIPVFSPSHLKAQLGKTVLPSSWVCWPHSIPCRLPDWGPQFLAGCWPEAILIMWHSPKSILWHRSLLPQSQQGRESASKRHIIILCNQEQIKPLLLYSDRERFNPHSRRGDYIRMWIPENGN